MQVYCNVTTDDAMNIHESAKLAVRNKDRGVVGFAFYRDGDLLLAFLSQLMCRSQYCRRTIPTSKTAPTPSFSFLVAVNWSAEITTEAIRYLDSTIRLIKDNNMHLIAAAGKSDVHSISEAVGCG